MLVKILAAALGLSFFMRLKLRIPLNDIPQQFQSLNSEGNHIALPITT
jgi:hypothetical protein